MSFGKRTLRYDNNGNDFYKGKMSRFGKIEAEPYLGDVKKFKNYDEFLDEITP